MYFTQEQRRRLDAQARREGKTLAQVVREAVDAHVGEEPLALAVVLDETFGSMPDFESPSRGDWNRGYG